MHAFIGLLMLIPSLSQPPGAQPYVGTWTAGFKGTTFIRLDIQMTNGTLTGRISVGDMHVDAKGHADRVGAAPAESTPIVIEDVTDSKLTFSRKDGDDTDHFEAQLITPLPLN